MKQFNLEEYLKNPKRKLVTRDGNAVRIICTDRKGNDASMIALVMRDGKESVISYHSNGKICADDFVRSTDLFFVPMKHEGWVNLYRRTNGTIITAPEIFDTKENALYNKSNDCEVTAKIEWED